MDHRYRSFLKEMQKVRDINSMQTPVRTDQATHRPAGLSSAADNALEITWTPSKACLIEAVQKLPGITCRQTSKEPHLQAPQAKQADMLPRTPHQPSRVNHAALPKPRTTRPPKTYATTQQSHTPSNPRQSPQRPEARALQQSELLHPVSKPLRRVCFDLTESAPGASTESTKQREAQERNAVNQEKDANHTRKRQLPSTRNVVKRAKIAAPSSPTAGSVNQSLETAFMEKASAFLGEMNDVLRTMLDTMNLIARQHSSNELPVRVASPNAAESQPSTTLKHVTLKRGLRELVLDSGIYVDARELEDCLKCFGKGKTRMTFRDRLRKIVFSNAALRACEEAGDYSILNSFVEKTILNFMRYSEANLLSVEFTE